jgi:autophagy-related protein 16
MTAIFTPQNRVISGSHDRTIKVFDIAKGYCIRNLFTVSSCNDVCTMDADGNVIVSGHMDGRVRFWDTRSGHLVREMDDVHAGAQVTSVGMAGVASSSTAPSPSSPHLLSAGRDDTLCVVDARMYAVLHRLQDPEFKVPFNWSRAALSPDARYAGAGGVDGSLFLWDVGGSGSEDGGGGGAPMARLREHGAMVCGVAWNPRGTGVYSVDRERNLLLWE